MTAPRNRWVWIAFGCQFLVLELLAALHVVPWPTLSSSAWYWLPDWWTWLLVAGLLLSLVAHLSPMRTSVVPVAGFGGGFCCRVAWVQWGPFDWLALLGLAAVLYLIAGLAWLRWTLVGCGDYWLRYWWLSLWALARWPYLAWRLRRLR